MQPFHAEIISIGEELLSSESETLDTNSVYLTQQLGGLGVRVLYKTTVGDDEGRITEVLRIALRRVPIVITTGGLGPTVDDMTRQAVANAIGRGLVFQQALLDEIAAKFARFNARMSPNNRVQAMLPEGAVAIPNPAGTAPGFYVEHDGAIILSLPGVPREMKAMLEQTVLPLLRQRLGAPRVIKTRILRTAGIGESHIDEQIGHLERLSNPTVGLNAHAGQTDIRITRAPRARRRRRRSSRPWRRRFAPSSARTSSEWARSRLSRRLPTLDALRRARRHRRAVHRRQPAAAAQQGDSARRQLALRRSSRFGAPAQQLRRRSAGGLRADGGGAAP